MSVLAVEVVYHKTSLRTIEHRLYTEVGVIRVHNTLICIEGVIKIDALDYFIDDITIITVKCGSASRVG